VGVWVAVGGEVWPRFSFWSTHGVLTGAPYLVQESRVLNGLFVALASGCRGHFLEVAIHVFDEEQARSVGRLQALVPALVRPARHKPRQDFATGQHVVAPRASFPTVFQNTSYELLPTASRQTLAMHLNPTMVFSLTAMLFRQKKASGKPCEIGVARILSFCECWCPERTKVSRIKQAVSQAENQ